MVQRHEKSQQNGRQAAILDRIAKKIDVHVYVIVYCLCAKFEQNQFWDV